MPGCNMYGTPRQTYAVLNNVFYPADGNGLIANVAQADVQALVAQECMSEAQWLKAQGGASRWRRPAFHAVFWRHNSTVAASGPQYRAHETDRRPPRSGRPSHALTPASWCR